MKKLILSILVGFSICTSAIAQDAVNVQVRFKKGVFECPKGDEIVDFNVAGGNTYEHTCSDGTWLNTFKEYNGVLTFSQAEYQDITAETKATKKNEQLNKWLNEVRNPPPYVEPSAEDYSNMINERLDEVQRYSEKLAEVATPEQMDAVVQKMAVQSEAVYVDSLRVLFKASKSQDKEVVRK